MVARFNQGVSVKTTHTTRQFGEHPSRASDGNTMKGMRGFIKTKQDPSSSGLTGRVGGGNSPKASGFEGHGPHREGAVPSRKLDSQDVSARKFNTKAFGGSSDNSYQGTSTASPGKIVSNKGTPIHRPAVDQRDSGRRQGGNKTAVSNSRIHSGKMESLRGRAKTSWEK